MKRIVAFLLTVSASVPIVAQQAPVDYRFDAVKRKVVLTTAKQEMRVDRGQKAHSGDKVQTGLFSYALIATDRYRARFEIFSSTNVLLAGGTPGVILSLERGRLRAAFDKITGNEPRVVQTPGALLAVRGTKYDVEVDGAGRTTVDVWEGIVELTSAARPEPILVHAGEESTFGRHEVPQVQPMPPSRHGPDEGMRPDTHGQPPPDSHGGTQPPTSHGTTPGAPPPPPSSTPPPPPKPPSGHH